MIFAFLSYVFSIYIVVETEDGNFHILDTNTYQYTTHNIQAYIKPYTLTLSPSSELNKIIPLETGIQVSNKAFIDSIHLDNNGIICYLDNSKLIQTPFNVFEIIEAPRIIKSTIMTGHKRTILKTINGITIFIIHIIIDIIDTKTNYTRQIHSSHIYHPFTSSNYTYKVKKSVLLYNKKRLNFQSNIIALYEIKKYYDNQYMVKVYSGPSLILYKPKISTLRWKYFVLLFIFLLLCILCMKYFVFKDLIKVKKIRRIAKNYKIYLGEFDKRDVLVKVYDTVDRVCKKEICFLETNHYKSIIKYLYKEIKKRQAFIVMEDGISIKKTGCAYQYGKDIKNFLCFLHEKGIAYNNINIDNILINKSKQIIFYNFEDVVDDEEVQINRDIGTIGWRSRDIILYNNGVGSINKEICIKNDVFGMGILLYYLEVGEHPFFISDSELEKECKKTKKYTAEEYSLIEENIVNCNYKLHNIRDKRLYDLIHHCLTPNHTERPSMKDISNHPFFWNFEKTFNFLANLSDILENKKEDTARLQGRLEKNRNKVFQKEWTECLHIEIVNDLNVYRNYNQKSLKGLLRAIRNKGRHYNEIPDNVKEIYGGFPNGFVEYYCKTFKSLIMVCHYSAKIMSDDELLKAYY
ncbi:Serine/threonine-protein kinase ppk4 [Astathelohania contejeani]|uniref:Serine/threonine-protein kinase ppk4 n=1 Tax=Astathelohania contejeani TaxID=164912 RepID=A0ABQ7I1K2_9MICR|nr:Serine/threonine-protein kinase ppk4 [Thelohania contejeani]